MLLNVYPITNNRLKTMKDYRFIRKGGILLLALLIVLTATLTTAMAASTWQIVGGDIVSSISADYISLCISDNGTPYIAFNDINNGYKPSVMKYDSSLGWQPVGTGPVTNYNSSFLALKVYNDTPYLAYHSNSTDAIVMKYDDIEDEWLQIGEPVSSSTPWYVSLHIAEDGTLYVATLDSYLYNPNFGGLLRVRMYVQLWRNG